jgi:hypothetical protein
MFNRPLLVVKLGLMLLSGVLCPDFETYRIVIACSRSFCEQKRLEIMDIGLA